MTNYLSDYNKVLASNQRGGGKHPLGLPKLMYLRSKLGGRGLKSVEKENEQTRIGRWLSCTVIQTLQCKWLEGMKRTLKTVIDGRELKMPGNMPVSSTSFVIYK